MNYLADYWSCRNGMPAADYTLHLLDCLRNDVMAATRGQDMVEETVRALAQPYDFRSPWDREVYILRRRLSLRQRVEMERP